MQRAGEDFPGTMAAVAGLSGSVVEELCREALEEGQRLKAEVQRLTALDEAH